MTRVIDWTLYIAVSFVLSLWGAFCAAILWAWFVVPSLAAPMLDTWQMAGLLLCVTAVKGVRTDDTERTPVERWVRMVAIGALFPLMCLAFGALLRAVQP